MAFGHQKLTVSTATGLTVPTDVNYAIMSVETGAMRVRVDGTNPTDAIGFLVSAGQELKVFGEDQLKNLKMIRVTSDSAVLNIQYGLTSHDIDHRIDING